MNTETATTPAAACITLEDKDCWIEVTIGRQKVYVDVAELSDSFSRIDKQHANDPWSCEHCGLEWVPSKEDRIHLRDHNTMPCPGCELVHLPEEFDEQGQPIAVVRPPQIFLDDVAAMMAKRFNVPRVGRVAAGEFYTTVVNALESLKKKNERLPRSLFGSTESTPDIGIPPDGGVGPL